MNVQVWIYRDRVLKDILLLFIITSLVFALMTLTTVSNHDYAEVWSKKTFQAIFEETVKDPFENESVFMSSKKRKYKDRRLNKYLDDDPDIAAEQKRHGSDNVRVIQ